MSSYLKSTLAPELQNELHAQLLSENILTPSQTTLVSSLTADISHKNANDVSW